MGPDALDCRVPRLDVDAGIPVRAHGPAEGSRSSPAVGRGRVIAFHSWQSPTELRLILGPTGTLIRRSPLRVREPDLKVIRWSDCRPGHTFVDTPPVLVVEVVSPLHGRRRDLIDKRHDYAAAGVPSYWVVDLDLVAVHILELAGQHYRDVALAEGDDLLELDRPFPVTFRPSDLVPRPPSA